MRILVCIKQIQDPDAPVILDETGLWVDETRPYAWIMNRYDEYALEEALLIGERMPDVRIDALTVGPARASAVIKKALEKGAHTGIHLRIKESGILAGHTSMMIAGYARANAYDLIFTGVMSEDLMQAQVGPMTAARLGIPCAVSIVAEAIDTAGGTIRVKTEIEGGLHEIITLSLPCLLTVQTGINTPRYPSLSNVLRAKNTEPVLIDAATEHGAREFDRVMSIHHPVRKHKGAVLDGTSVDKANALLAVFHEKGLLR